MKACAESGQLQQTQVALNFSCCWEHDKIGLNSGFGIHIICTVELKRSTVANGVALARVEGLNRVE